MAVMLSSLRRTRGSSSTPTLIDFAVRNGDLLNLGSSATDKLSAAREPENKERRGQDENDQDGNDDEYDAKCTAHEQPPARQARQRERERVVVKGILAQALQIPSTGETRCKGRRRSTMRQIRTRARR